MLAFAWYWADEHAPKPEGLARRLANSLCAGIGGTSAAVDTDGLNFAYRSLTASIAAARAWRPVLLPSGRLVAFHGYFDNALDIARALDAAPSDPARLYGLAVERWGDEADRRIIGEYCAVIADPRKRHVRLARSPLRAPPLHYGSDAGRVAASSVPRALFAAGFEQKLNERHVADSALINFSDAEETWFEGISRVPLASIVELRPRRARALRTYYDILAVPDVQLGSGAEYVERANELLGQGVRACLAGSGRPGSTLSSGLDSSQVVVHALRQLPENQRLPTFTFHPEEGWDGIVESGMNGNERPMVEAFAKMHPRIDPHFTANEGYGHDHRWNDFFHLMGGAPSGLCNMYVFHGLFAKARELGCDRLLIAEWGNFTFSDKGTWAYPEYLRRGQWRQLWLALRRKPNDRRSLLRKFIALSLVPYLPDRVWRALMRVWHPGDRHWIDMMTPLSPAYRAASGADQRVRNAGLRLNRYHPLNRRQAKAHLFQNNESESGEIYQAFEQAYGVTQRDPTAYRPLVEFCFGLPTEVFMRDGEDRWLAKEMARGIMPEEQRVNRRNGRWDSDWHLRIGRRRDEYRAELDGIARDPRLSAMLDVPRLHAALEDFPARTDLDEQRMFPIEFAVPRGLLTARFVRYVEGSNTA